MSTEINVADIESKIAAKGDEIRQLKADGIEKDALKSYIAELLALKAQLPSVEDQIKAKGDEIRKLKEDGVDKDSLAPYIEQLLALKAQMEPAEKPT